MTENIRKTEAYLKEKLLSQDDNNRYDWQYRYEHSIRVARVGQIIAREEGFDEEALIIGCLLHDIGYIACKSNEDHNVHGRFSAQIAREYLTSIELEPERIDTICYGIKIHTEPEEEYERMPTPFEMSIADADNIDRFDAYRLYMNLKYMNLEEMTPDQMIESAKQRTERYEKYIKMECGTKTAATLWQDIIGFQLEYMKRLGTQMEQMQGFYKELIEER